MAYSFAESVGQNMIAHEQYILYGLQRLLKEPIISGTDFVSALDLYTVDDLLFTLHKGNCIDLTEYASHQDALSMLEQYLESTADTMLPDQSTRHWWVAVLAQDYERYVEKLKCEFQEKFGFQPQVLDVAQRRVIAL